MKLYTAKLQYIVSIWVTLNNSYLLSKELQSDIYIIDQKSLNLEIGKLSQLLCH